MGEGKRGGVCVHRRMNKCNKGTCLCTCIEYFTLQYICMSNMCEREKEKERERENLGGAC